VLAQQRYLAGTDAQRALDLVCCGAQDIAAVSVRARLRHGAHRRRAPRPRSSPPPKVFCGFSDITKLHAACARAGLVSFYGPMVAWDLARRGGFDEASLRAMLMEDGRGSRSSGRGEVLVRGRATGRLVGGCLSLVVARSHARGIDTRGALLVLEDEEGTGYRIDRMLTQLRRAESSTACAGSCSGIFRSASRRGRRLRAGGRAARSPGRPRGAVAWRFRSATPCSRT